jgi:hypothetical protein
MDSNGASKEHIPKPQPLSDGTASPSRTNTQLASMNSKSIQEQLVAHFYTLRS